jgi:hypothetical protein
MRSSRSAITAPGTDPSAIPNRGDATSR